MLLWLAQRGRRELRDLRNHTSRQTDERDPIDQFIVSACVLGLKTGGVPPLSFFSIKNWHTASLTLGSLWPAKEDGGPENEASIQLLYSSYIILVPSSRGWGSLHGPTPNTFQEVVCSISDDPELSQARDRDGLSNAQPSSTSRQAGGIPVRVTLSAA